MSTNKNAAIRYQALDKCFRDRRHRYYIDDLINACDEALIYYNGTGGVSRRQIFEDIKFMESETGWSIPLELVNWRNCFSFGPDVLIYFYKYMLLNYE